MRHFRARYRRRRGTVDCLICKMLQEILVPGERVGLIVVRRPDPSRWGLERIAKTVNAEDAVLAEQGLAEWSANLDLQELSELNWQQMKYWDASNL